MSEVQKPLNELTQDILHSRSEHLEMMAAAYLKETNISPLDVEYVEWYDAAGTYHCHFQKRLETIRESNTKTLVFKQEDASHFGGFDFV